MQSDGANLVAEYDSGGNVLRRFVFAPGVDEPLVWYESSGISSTTRRFLHADERGSIVAVSDNAGNLSGAINRYDDYGAPQGGVVNGRFGYTGQAWLPEIQMYYYRARVYNPDLGRFMQTDPIGHLGGMNLYAYVLNDPVNLVDPSGLSNMGIEVILKRRQVDGWYRPTLPNDIRDLGRHFTNDRIGAPPSERVDGEENEEEKPFCDEPGADQNDCTLIVRMHRRSNVILVQATQGLGYSDGEDEFRRRNSLEGVITGLGRGLRDSARAAMRYLRNCISGFSSDPSRVGAAASEGAIQGAATGGVRGFIIGSRMGPAGSGWGTAGGMVGGVLAGGARGAVTGACRAGNED